MSKLEASISNSESAKIRCFLEKGKRINYDRCISQKFQPLQNDSKMENSKNTYIYKLIHPRENLQFKCNHGQSQIPNRGCFTREKYIEFLSTPKKVDQKQAPTLIMKKLTPCTFHLNSLAKPHKNRLINTLRSYRFYFSFEKIEKIISMISENTTPEQAMQILKQRIRDRRNKIKAQECTIKRIKGKIAKCEKFQKISWDALEKLSKVLQNDKLVQHYIDLNKLPEFIFRILCQITLRLVNPALKKSTTRAYMVIASKLAQKIQLKRQKVQSETDESGCRKGIFRHCIPIESFFSSNLLKSESDSFDQNDGSSESGVSLNNRSDEISLDDEVVMSERDEEMKENEKITDEITSGSDEEAGNEGGEVDGIDGNDADKNKQSSLEMERNSKDVKGGNKIIKNQPTRKKKKIQRNNDAVQSFSNVENDESSENSRWEIEWKKK